ncbi:MAG: cell division FtsA domain-containing protein [bacterium]
MNLKGKLLLIDPGSRFIRMGVLDFHSDGAPDLVFVKAYESKGINNGSISSRGEFAAALRNAYENCRHDSGIGSFKEIWVGHSGQSTRSDNITEEAKLRHNVPITLRLEKQMMKNAESRIPGDSQLLHSFRQFLFLDGVKIESDSRLLGMNLLARYHVIFSKKDVINNFRAAFRDAGLKLSRFLFNGYTASLAVGHAEEFNLGCMVIHLGHSTVDYIVYQEGQPYITGSLNDGWRRVIREVAMGESLSDENAEKAIRDYGVAHDIDPSQDTTLDVINLFGETSQVTRRHLAIIMSATIEEIFTIIRDRLKDTICRGHLPGGILLTGGGALTRGIAYSAVSVFGVHTRVEYPSLPWIKQEYEPEWAPLLGMAKEASENIFYVPIPEKTSERIGFFGSRLFKRMFPKSAQDIDPEGEPEK